MGVCCATLLARSPTEPVARFEQHDRVVVPHMIGTNQDHIPGQPAGTDKVSYCTGHDIDSQET